MAQKIEVVHHLGQREYECLHKITNGIQKVGDRFASLGNLHDRIFSASLSTKLRTFLEQAIDQAIVETKKD